MKAQYLKKPLGTDNAGNCIQTNPKINTKRIDTV